MRVSSDDGTLDCVHGVRFLSMTWVIRGHTYFFLSVTGPGSGKNEYGIINPFLIKYRIHSFNTPLHRNLSYTRLL